jgi:fused signal recognition particle receptor
MSEQAASDAAGREGLWRRLRGGLSRTRGQLVDRISAAVEGRGLADDETLEDLEEALIAADLGVETSLELIERVRAGLRPGEMGDAFRLRELLHDEISVLLLDAPPPPAAPTGPTLTLVVGVNGVGKTTSLAKLARLSQTRGRRPLLAAGDTFRAAAIEQLVVWGERLDVEVVHQKAGGDPAAVVYDAIHAARARSVDDLIVDTAGRLHTKANLMAELAKIGRVADREGGGFARRTLLVLDATGGHNALSQARQFNEAVALDGVVLAKIDGTAKGGIVVALARDLRLPVLFLGVGEGADDLVPFQPRDFARALLG